MLSTFNPVIVFRSGETCNNGWMPKSKLKNLDYKPLLACLNWYKRTSIWLFMHANYSKNVHNVIFLASQIRFYQEVAFRRPSLWQNETMPCGVTWGKQEMHLSRLMTNSLLSKAEQDNRVRKIPATHKSIKKLIQQS